MSDDLSAAFEGLRREYIAEAPARLAELRKDVQAFKVGEPDAAQSLRTRFHRLAGSGGSYGFPAISDISREMEQWLKSGSPAASDENASRLDDAVNRLAAAFDAAANELGLSDAGKPGGEFGWRALVIGGEGALREQVIGALRSSGFEVSYEPDSAEPRHLNLSQRPDLVVIMANPQVDFYATATAWSGSGAGRPRSIVAVDAGDSTDRIRAVAAGIDLVLPSERVNVELAKYAKLLARIGSPPPRVLLVEEDAAQAAAITAWLEQANARVTHCRDGISARDLLVRETPDIILMDLRLPGIDGISLTRLVRQDARFNLIPIVFLTAQDTVAVQIEAINAGADHFLIEPVDQQLLTQLVVNRAERGRRLREMVHRDGLTGLLNHATLMAELEHAIEYARRHGESFAFLMIDVDHFKRVNDRYGHLIGDRVLLHVARIFQNTARASDLIGRYGGEEFGLILRRTDRQGAAVLAGKLRQALAQHPAPVGEQETIPVRICIGIACYPHDGLTANDLAVQADQALYRAKASGRDRVEFAG